MVKTIKRMEKMAKSALYEPEFFKSVKVNVTLKPEMHVGYNKWMITVNGEKRLVTSDRVEWYAHTVEEAAKSFNTSEIISFNISG